MGIVKKTSYFLKLFFVSCFTLLSLLHTFCVMCDCVRFCIAWHGNGMVAFSYPAHNEWEVFSFAALRRAFFLMDDCLAYSRFSFADLAIAGLYVW